MMKKKWISMMLAVGLAANAMADEVAVKKNLQEKYKSLPANVLVKKTEINGMYEVNLLGQEAYTDEKVSFLLVGGSLINPKNLEDLTAKRKNQFLADFYQSLPLDKAIKTVYGKGERQFVTFEDPDCPLCQAQHVQWRKKEKELNATVYTFLFPLTIHPDARKKAEFIWCQKDPSASWSLWMEKGQGLPLNPNRTLNQKEENCKKGVETVKETEALARSLGYRQTPRFIMENGLGASGALEVEALQEVLVSVNKSMEELKASNKPQEIVKPTKK